MVVRADINIVAYPLPCVKWQSSGPGTVTSNVQILVSDAKPKLLGAD